MKRLIALSIIAMVLFFATGCARQEASGPAPPLENQISEKHQEFQEMKQWGQVAFGVCGSLVICGVLFKLCAIVSGIISGMRLGRKVRRTKEARAREAWRNEMSDYQIECLRHKEYMEERHREKQKSPRP